MRNFRVINISFLMEKTMSNMDLIMDLIQLFITTYVEFKPTSMYNQHYLNSNI